jgi:hypothetical protein
VLDLLELERLEVERVEPVLRLEVPLRVDRLLLELALRVLAMRLLRVVYACRRRFPVVAGGQTKEGGPPGPADRPASDATLPLWRDPSG